MTSKSDRNSPKTGSSTGADRPAGSQGANTNQPVVDGPASPHFEALSLNGNATLGDLPGLGISEEMAAALEHAPMGNCVCWGIPFHVDKVVVLDNKPVSVSLEPTTTQWLVFLHTSDKMPLEWNEHGFVSPMSGHGHLNEKAALYTVLYQDGSEVRLPIRRRHQIGAFQRVWGENCFESVCHSKPHPIRPHHEQTAQSWGNSQTRATPADSDEWVNWLWAWLNPDPDKPIVGLRLEPASGIVVLSGLAGGKASAHPLRWETRRKAVMTLPEGDVFAPGLDQNGLLEQVRLDMGQVISATPRLRYPNDTWGSTYNNSLPETLENEVVLEYTAHPEAALHLANGQTVPLADMAAQEATGADRGTFQVSASATTFLVVAEASRLVSLRVVEKGSRREVPVKLHVHGQAGEYLAPNDRHRIPNPAWFEDYSPDFSHNGIHHCTYIPGKTRIALPIGDVYIEISKGFEIKPIRRTFEVTAATEQIEIEIEKVLTWREEGWVSADTHVHFLSPMTALLEGSGEGVNVVNLLASQWGELMTNVGDFDGKMTWGSAETGGDGEYLVRVGTENRQHVMGHISLLGYEGQIIAPMTTGGPRESAIGDPIEVLLTEWARQCRKQGGLVVLPHFPNPRAEHAATIVSGDVDGVEMTSWGDLYSGINPYSLADWYRYLNCGYPTAAVAGTDKMSVSTAVGTVRTYARIKPDKKFDYPAWMDAVRRGETFVTYGPLLEFSVEGRPMGSRLSLKRSGGTVTAAWKVASVTIPISRVDLVVNGEIRESRTVPAGGGSGQWTVNLERSSWLALLVRGHYADQIEVIAAHSSPVTVAVDGSQFYAAADALTILEQIEGATAYLDTVGTRAETAAYKRMRLVLESAHREIHNRMHAQGNFHEHSPMTDHDEHH